MVHYARSPGARPWRALELCPRRMSDGCPFCIGPCLACRMQILKCLELSSCPLINAPHAGFACIGVGMFVHCPGSEFSCLVLANPFRSPHGPRCRGLPWDACHAHAIADFSKSTNDSSLIQLLRLSLLSEVVGSFRPPPAHSPLQMPPALDHSRGPGVGFDPSPGIGFGTLRDHSVICRMHVSRHPPSSSASSCTRPVAYYLPADRAAGCPSLPVVGDFLKTASPAITGTDLVVP
jgi:hypothetical protein